VVKFLLQREQPVDVVLDGGWRLTARVAAVAGDHVDLGAVDGIAHLPGQLRSGQATMTWRTRYGAVERRGTLIEVADAPGLRLLTPDEAIPVQRREFVRVPADLPVAVIGESGRLSARTADLSIGGMLLAPPAPASLGLGESVRFVLDLGDLSIRGDGVVVRGDADGTRAVHFDALQGRVERAISRYVARRQRELIAAR
jgi:hypothetical protein